MLLEMAVADAYAIAWEFTDQQAATPDLTHFLQHPTYAELQPGQYTDDTQRTIANAMVLLSPRPWDKFSAPAYADAYLGAYRADPREGYSRGYQAFLKSCKDPSEFLLRCSRTALSNGSVMGAAVIGFLPTVEEVKLAATVQATTTHHPETAIHAQIVALAAHFFIHQNGYRGGLREFIFDNADWPKSTDASYRWSYLVDRYGDGGKTGIRASSISSYVVWALENHNSLTSILMDACSRGGDTDSAAASAIAVASCCRAGMEKDLPQNLVDDLEKHGTHGVEYLGQLEAALRDIFIKEPRP